jgi:alpha-beta hydrolase superfamily lysophospholipase
VESGRVYRTRRYDVYLPPPAPARTTYTPVFTTTTTTTNAILFLPGMGVEQVAYSVPATMLSNAGYTVVVVSAEPLLYGLPAVGTNVSSMRRIQRGIEQRHYHSSFRFKRAAGKKSSKTSTPSRQPKMTWALLGHSLGAFTVCQLAEEFCKSSDTTKANLKVVLWAVAPFIGFLPDLSGHQRLPVLVVQGSRDDIIETFATEELTKQFWQRLPEDAAEVVVVGGTHSGFANYASLWTKKEKGGISNEEQQRQAVRATVDFLQKN